MITVKNAMAYKKSFPISGPTRIEGGNFIEADFLNPAAYALELFAGNFAGCKFDGASPAGPQDVPGCVTITGTARLTYGFVDVPKAADPKAIGLLEALDYIAGPDLRALWLWTVEDILTNPGILETARRQRLADWAQKQNAYASRPGDKNVIETVTAMDRLIEKFFPGLTFDEMQTEIATQNLSAWSGEPVA